GHLGLQFGQPGLHGCQVLCHYDNKVGRFARFHPLILIEPEGHDRGLARGLLDHLVEGLQRHGDAFRQGGLAVPEEGTGVEVAVVAPVTLVIELVARAPGLAATKATGDEGFVEFGHAVTEVGYHYRATAATFLRGALRGARRAGWVLASSRILARCSRRMSSAVILASGASWRSW